MKKVLLLLLFIAVSTSAFADNEAEYRNKKEEITDRYNKMLREQIDIHLTPYEDAPKELKDKQRKIYFKVIEPIVERREREYQLIIDTYRPRTEMIRRERKDEMRNKKLRKKSWEKDYSEQKVYQKTYQKTLEENRKKEPAKDAGGEAVWVDKDGKVHEMKF